MIGLKGQGHDLSDGQWPKFSITMFTRDEFQEFWPAIEKMLDSVPHTWDHWTKDYIVEAALTGRIQVWGIGPPPKSILCVMTSIHIYPAMRVFCIDWAGGHFDEEMIPLLEATWTDYAKLNGCAQCEVRGRIGWEPYFKRVGFTRDAVVWKKTIPDIRKH